jgi:3-oxoacyl-[acyl-carrier-protein] synthase-3
MKHNVGILGLGMHLPSEVRENAWWPRAVVDRWLVQRPVEAVAADELVDATVQAMRDQAADPFQGARARRILPTGQTALDMEVAAATSAIERAGLDRREIDLVLTEALVPPALATNAACALHHRLGLRTDCFTLQTVGAQHAFLLQLSIAEAMIAAGRARHALLVQSSAASRVLDYDDRMSAVFGDGATAAIVGPVGDGHGMLAAVHETDGALWHALIVGVRGKSWYDDGRAVLHVADPVAMRDVVRSTVTLCTRTIAAALARAGISRDEVRVVAMHQGLSWLRTVVQKEAGLEHALAADTYAETGHLFGCSVPSTLANAEARDLLHAGHVVVLAGGGNGMTYGATVIRWGRA